MITHYHSLVSERNNTFAALPMKQNNSNLVVGLLLLFVVAGLNYQMSAVKVSLL